MKAAIAFFLSLCFLLLGRYDAVHAGDYHLGNQLPAQQIEKTQLTKLRNTNQAFSLVKSNHLIEKREDLMSAEDEVEDLVFSRKYVLLSKYFITLACASLLIYCCSYFKNRLPFCKHLSYASSYKYILQRVLRI